MLHVRKFDLKEIRFLCQMIYTIWEFDTKLPEELKWVYFEHTSFSSTSRTIWNGRPYDYVCLIRYLNRMSQETKHNALCRAMDKMELELSANRKTEAEYIKVCDELKEFSNYMKSIGDIIDVVECHFVPEDVLPESGQYLELKYKKYHEYDSELTRQVVWVSPEGRLVF